jgi:glycosyltransferase involved in cell wall biosynthesis
MEEGSVTHAERRNSVSDPAISVVVPTRNRSADLGRCLDALAAQDIPLESFEVLVCDDGSTEPIDSVVGERARRGLQVRHLSQSPKGPAAARNLGIRNARAEIVAMTDSDTLPDRGWLRRLSEALAANPEAVAVEGQVYANNEGEFDPLGEGPSNRSGGVYLTCNCAYRRSVLIAIGGLDETFPYPAYEDAELAAIAQKFGPIIWSPEAVVLHPQRPMTIGTIWKKLHHWEYVLIMAHRYGYLVWKRYPVKHPRLRVIGLSVVALPLSKIRTALGWLERRPGAALKLAGFGVVESLGAIVLVAPMALFGRYQDRAIRRKYL